MTAGVLFQLQIVHRVDRQGGRAADFKAHFKISLAAALAKEKKAELVTGDPEFKPLAKEINVIWLK